MSNHTEQRVADLMAAAERQGWKVSDRISTTGTLTFRSVELIFNFDHGLEAWLIELRNGLLNAVVESFVGEAVSGPRLGKEINLRHKTSLRDAEHRFEVK